MTAKAERRLARRLKRAFVVIVCLAAAGAAVSAHSADSAAGAPGTPVTLYRGARLIDGAGGLARPAMAILVRGERIAAIGLIGSLAPPPGARVVDVTGLFVLPGLVNSHEHLATPPDRPWAEAQMKRDLYGGVTTVRDMADDLRQVADLARASRVGEIPGPDIFYAALMAGPEFFDDPRTHAAARGAVAGQVPWMRAITHATDLRQALAEAKGTGATAVKIYADLPADLVAAIAAEAHRQGMMAWAHAAVFPASPAQVIDAGVDTVSHTCMLAYQVSDAMPRAYRPRAGVDEARAAPGNPVIAALFADMRRRGTILDATLYVYQEMADDHAADPKSAAPYCSVGLAERLTGEARRAGVAISAGTDGFSPPADAWPALQDELILLQDKAGLTPAEVVRAATLTGAMTMHRQDEIGTLAPGKLADLVFVSEDPLKDVRAFKSVVLTVKRGAPYWRKDYHPSPAELTERPD